MPIGKNSIKRVQNSGYSNVKTTAPDMENSTVLANPSPEVIEVFVTPKEKKNTRKSKEKVTNKSTIVAKPSKATTKKDTTKTKTNTQKRGKAAQAPAAKENSSSSATTYVNLGKPLPTHLL